MTATGKASGGEMHYALGTKDAATQPYTTSAPSKTGAGTYYVWYKVVATDGNYNNTDPKYIKVQIKKKSAPVPTGPSTYDVTFIVVNGA